MHGQLAVVLNGSPLINRLGRDRRNARARGAAQAGSHVPLDSVADELAAVRARNDAQRGRAERVATERMALEARARQAEARVAELEAAAEAQLGGLPPGQRATYQASGMEEGAGRPSKWGDTALQGARAGGKFSETLTAVHGVCQAVAVHASKHRQPLPIHACLPAARLRRQTRHRAQALQQEREALFAEAAARNAELQQLDADVLAAEGVHGSVPPI